MNSDRLLEVYEQISEAPDAIARLRRFVLNLAVRGKLVEQDATDEPASKLLAEIASERARRIHKGELKTAKGIPAPKPSDQLFSAPPGWLWTVADQVWDFENGDRGKNYPSRDQLVESGIPFINAGHLTEGRVDMSEMNFVTPEKFQQIGGGKLRQSDQIYCLRGLLGKHAVFDLETDAAIASSLVILRPIVPDCVPYLFIFLDSDVSDKSLRQFDNGSAQPNLSSANLRKYHIPLPPLAEQQRIVAKVDELMALCDRLEEARKIREETRDKLTAASLTRLTAPDTTPEDFPAHASFAIEALPALTTRPDQIKTLRQTILNLAVGGKLVTPDPADEPASGLINRIAAAKTRLVKAGEIRKQKPFEAIDQEPFPIPQNWQWVRLGELGITQTGSTPPKSRQDYYGSDVPFIRPGDLYPDHVDYSEQGLSRAGAEASGRLVHEGSLLMVCIGTVG